MPTDSYPFDTNNHPEILSQFTRNPLYKEEYDRSDGQFMVRYKYLKKFKFCNVRIFLHEFAKKLDDEGWIDIWHPNDQLSHMMHRCRRYNLNRLRQSDHEYLESIWCYKFSQPILASLTNMRDHTNGVIDKAWTTKPLLRAMNRLYRKKKSITRFNLFCELKSKFTGLSLGYPMSMASFLQNHTRGPIDDHTCSPWISLACTIAGIPYNNGNSKILITDREDELNDRKTVLYLGDLENHTEKFYIYGPNDHSKTKIITIKYN
ncbi:MAG: hypothetical protein GF411_14305 [Candidatus Lokiarchaeota archaeon]|nr:hypothetical protein [Candidatus Lokiarchaeota archaeon]